MDITRLTQLSDYQWQIAPHGNMRVPGIIFASRELIDEMDYKVYEQVTNVATLPGIIKASYAMPDAHWGYGFPIGGVAAFDPDEGGVVSAGGVGFDISCGVRTLHTGLTIRDFQQYKTLIADRLFMNIPAGVGSTGRITLPIHEMDRMLEGGAKWAVQKGYGRKEDLQHMEEQGCMQGADPAQVSEHAKKRQHREMGTLGSGNHYLEVQHVTEIYNSHIAESYGIRKDDILISIHCGSRGLGHQIGTEFLKSMLLSPESKHIKLPDRELACAPIHSVIGKSYLGAMRSAINCALANRQILTWLTREVFESTIPGADLTLLYDVSHNTCKVEKHKIDGSEKSVFIHRKGATRAFGPGNPDIPAAHRAVGQPVLIGGTMGTASCILAGTTTSETQAFSSACHGAGRSMSRHQAKKRWSGRQIIDELGQKGILIRSPSLRGIAEEAPGAYKDISAVVDAAHMAGLAEKVARLEPVVCIKG